MFWLTRVISSCRIRKPQIYFFFHAEPTKISLPHGNSFALTVDYLYEQKGFKYQDLIMSTHYMQYLFKRRKEVVEKINCSASCPDDCPNCKFRNGRSARILIVRNSPGGTGFSCSHDLLVFANYSVLAGYETHLITESFFKRISKEICEKLDPGLRRTGSSVETIFKGNPAFSLRLCSPYYCL